MHTSDTTRGRGWVLWLPGLLVALGAAVATAHGLYETARAAAAPPLIAALYPLITDGLALVAYAATARLVGSARRYAWTVVVLAAGLSGLAQASYLAHGVAQAPAALRFGVGAWPAIAAAIVAHLLFLIATATRGTTRQDAVPTVTTEAGEPPSNAEPDPAPETPNTAAWFADAEGPPVQPPSVQPEPYTRPSIEQPPYTGPSVQSDPVQSAPSDPPTHPALAPVQPARSDAVQEPFTRAAGSPARARADAAAKRALAESGELPTVTALMALAEVSRGTAGEALKALRQQPAPLHLVHQHTPSEAHR